jgi:hypothetical protein
MEAFEVWVQNTIHPEGGYRLDKIASGTYIDPETRCAYRGFRAGRAAALEEAAKACDEMQEHYSAYRDTALLNGDIALSNAASGEPRAAEFIATTLRQLKDQQ